MEALRDLLGNFSSGIIRLGVAVGILAAVGFFIVRPILDTTENVSREVKEGQREANEALRNSFSESFKNADLDEIEETLKGVGNKSVKVEVQRSFHVATVKGGRYEPSKLLKCVERANGNVDRLQRCAKRFG